jgi:AcrR family transcriptional regulator
MPPATRRLPRSSSSYRSYPGGPYAGKLPRGPHSLTREQVAANQRLRVGMAMLEAIGEKGYVATTVSEVVARAGVSRKAFYQHFTNKEECFLATYDAIAMEGRRRVLRALSESDGHPDRMETAIRTVFEAAMENPDALRLAITEITAVGPTGIERRERSMAEYAELIHAGLRSGPRVNGHSGERPARRPGGRTTRREGTRAAGRNSERATARTRPDMNADGGELPAMTLRAIVGGFNKVLIACLHGGRGAKPLELVPDLARWASSYYPAPAQLTERLQESRKLCKLAHATQDGGRAPGTLAPRHGDRRRFQRTGYMASRSYVVHNQRERIIDAVANLTASNGYGALRVEEIAAEASVSLQAFYEHFESKEDAFLVAYELGHARGLDIVERCFANATDWRTGVREGLSGLLVYLASEPAFAQLALGATVIATPRASELSSRGVAAYAQLLAPGFEEVPKRMRPPAIAVEAIAGGLREMFLHYTVQGRAQDLTELAVDATYVALAPFIGPQAAAEVAIEPAWG